MAISYNGKKYIVNEEDSVASEKICNEFISKMMDKCKEKGREDFFVIILIIMIQTCKSMLKNIGSAGFRILLLKRMRIEKENKESDSNITGER